MELAFSAGAPLLIDKSRVLSESPWLDTLHSANLPRRFWPDALRHFCRLYAYWPDDNGLSAWEKLDHLQPNELRHNLVKDLNVFGSYVTGHLSRAHPHVTDTTHDDRVEEGVFLGNLIFGCISFVSTRSWYLTVIPIIGIISCPSCSLGMFPIRSL